MTYADLKTKLDSAKTGTDIVQVVFDYTTYLNYGSKTYPLALWDIGNATGTIDRREGVKELNMDLWILTEVEPEDDVVNRHAAWDTIQTAFLEYIAEVDDQDDLTVETTEPEFEHFPAGLLSLEREMAIRYRITLKLWC